MLQHSYDCKMKHVHVCKYSPDRWLTSLFDRQMKILWWRKRFENGKHQNCVASGLAAYGRKILLILASSIFISKKNHRTVLSVDIYCSWYCVNFVVDPGWFIVDFSRQIITSGFKPDLSNVTNPFIQDTSCQTLHYVLRIYLSLCYFALHFPSEIWPGMWMISTVLRKYLWMFKDTFQSIKFARDACSSVSWVNYLTLQEELR